MSVLVSVIIPTYGRSESLGKAIESVLYQTYTALEIIVVDDNGSLVDASSSTAQVVQTYVENDSRVRYLRLERNVGGSLSRNAGVEAASGELITFLDDDDFYLPEKIEQQVAVFSKTGCDICNCSMYALDQNRLASYIRTEPYGLTLHDFILNGSAFTPMIMVRKELFCRVGGFVDTPRFQDHLLMLRLLSMNPRVEILTERLFVHVLHLDGRVSHSPKSRKAFLIRHELENNLSYCLSEGEKATLKKKQDLDLLECDLLEFGFFGNIRSLIDRAGKTSSFTEFCELLNFALRKMLRRNYFVWKVRRAFFSKSIEGLNL